MTQNSEWSFSSEQLKEYVQDILQQAHQKGASSCEVSIAESWGYSTGVRNQAPESVEYNRDREFSLTVYIGQRTGHASTSDFSVSSITQVIDKALTIARFTGEDLCSGLAPKELMAGGAEKDLDLFHPWDLSVSQAQNMALICEQSALDEHPQITNSEGASVGFYQGQSIYGNSYGFTGFEQSSRYSISCSVIAGVNEAMQRDYWYSQACAPQDLESVESIGSKSAIRASRRLGARSIKTCQVPVLFDATVAGSLIGHLVAGLRGSAQYHESSFLTGALGRALFCPSFELFEDPHLPRGLGSAWFDGEGVRTLPRSIVSGGVIQGYFLDSYSARKLKRETTGNAGGSHNLILAPFGGGDLGDLLKKMDRGLWVTELMGQGVNPTTGDYSRGAAGFWVERGQIQYPVHEITIAGQLEDMFQKIVSVGTDTYVQGSKITGSILVESMTVAGN